MPDDQLENKNQNKPTESVTVEQNTNLPDEKTVPEKIDNKNNTKKPNNKFKKFILPGVVLGLLLVGGTSAYGLMSWYQAPQNVITDSFIHAMTAKKSIYTGTFSFSDATGENEVVIDLNMKNQDALGSIESNISIKSGAVNLSIKATSVVDSKGDVYIKASGLSQIVDEYAVQLGMDSSSQLITSVNNFVAKIDNKWIKISSDDLKEYNEDISSAQKCMSETIKKYETDQVALNQITDTYLKNQFIISDKDLGIEKSNHGFRLAIDEVKTKSFAKDIQNTTIYKSLNKCDGETFKIDESTVDQEINKINDSSDSTNDSSQGYVDLWVDNWSHDIVKIEISSESDSGKFKANIEPKYNIEISISVPNDSISMSELKSYIEELMSSYASSYEYSSDY